jgi:hypothetical protein
MATSALARSKNEAALARARASSQAAVSRARQQASGAVASARARVNAIKLQQEARTATGVALMGVGAVGAGQVARMTLFPNKETGVSRAPWVNFGAGVIGFAALATGKARSNEAMGLAATGIGMGLGQLAITSKESWDLVPGTIWGA